MSRLYVVATPIGNLEDVSARGLRILGEVAAIAAEDTRVTARLLARHSIRKPLISYRAPVERRGLPRVLAALEGGDVALVSDAGTPTLSDPGQVLVTAAWAAGTRSCQFLGRARSRPRFRSRDTAVPGSRSSVISRASPAR